MTKSNIERKREQLNLEKDIPDEEVLQLYLNPYDCNEYYIAEKEKEPPTYNHNINLCHPCIIDMLSSQFTFNAEFNAWTTGLTKHINDLKMFDLDNCIYLGDSEKLPLKGTIFEYYYLLNNLKKNEAEKIVNDNITLQNTLTRKKNGDIECSSYNLKAIFRQDKKIGRLFYYDSFSNNIKFARKPFYRTASIDDEITDYDIKFLMAYIEDNYNIYNLNKTIGALDIVAHERVVNRPRRWLKSLKWDGKNRLETFLIEWYKVDDNAYNRYVFKDWLINLVAKIMKEAHHYDICLALIGEQGIGKSLLFRKLATIDFNKPREHYYVDMQLTDTANEKDIILALSKGFIFEWKEMQGYSSKNINYIKSFLDKSDDTIRRPYNVFTENLPRRVCFGGTTNDGTPLRDKSGNRRFYTVKSNLAYRECLIKDETKFTTAYKNQLFAEALAYLPTYDFNNKPEEVERLWLNESEAKVKKYTYEGQIISFLNSYIFKDYYSYSMRDMILYYDNYNWINKPTNTEERKYFLRKRVALKEIWDVALKKSSQKMTTNDKIEIESVLKKQGFIMCSGNFGVYGDIGYARKENDEYELPF